jgi:hypothetical protein
MIIFALLLFFFLLVGFCAASDNNGAKTPDKPDATKNDQEKKEEENNDIFSEKDLAAQQLRFNKQCYLIDKFEELSPWAYGEGKPKHYTMITGDPAEVTNELVTKKKASALFQIKPYQIAFLVPRIRLFLVREINKKEEEQELHFAAHFNATQVAASGEVQNIFKSGDMRGEGAGIKSFSYDLAGVNPAEADKLITSKLVLYFQSVGDLFAHRGKFSNGESFRFADLINYNQRLDAKGKKKGTDPRSIIEEQYRIKAVVGWSEPSIIAKQREGLISPELASALVQSKTTLFLQLIDHTISFQQEGNIELEIQYMAALQHMIERSYMDLFWLPTDVIAASLQQASTSGGFVLAQKSRSRGVKAINDARLALAQLKEADFKGANKRNFSDKLKKIEEDLAKGLSLQDGDYGKHFNKEGLHAQEHGPLQAGEEITIESFSDAVYVDALTLKAGLIVDNANKTSTLGKKARTTVYLDAIEQRLIADEKKATDSALAAAAELEKLKNRRKEVIYKRIIEKVMKMGNVYVLQVPEDEVGIFGSESQPRIGTTKTTNKVRTSSQKSTPAIHHSHVKTKAIKEAANSTEPVDTVTDKFNVLTMDEAAAAVKKGFVYIHFFFFGDLVDAAIEILKQPVSMDSKGEGQEFKNEKAIAALEKFSILLGPAVFRKKDGDGIIVNVAQVPISLDLFLQWFMDKVVKSQITSYQLRNFLQDAIKGLVAPALGQGCFAGYAQSGKMSMIPLSVPSMAGGAGGRIPKIGARCELKQLRGRHGAKLKPEATSNNIRKLDHYFYFFVQDNITKKRAVDVEKDSKTGIHHLRIGEDRGIVKAIDFHQTDIQFLKEARITNDADVKDGFLRKKYDATIKTIGNSLFAPGQYIYVHPTVPGYSDHVRENLQKIGLGGYYLVTKVFHIVSEEYYQAEIEAKWEAYGVPLASIGAEGGGNYNIIGPARGGSDCTRNDPAKLATFNLASKAAEAATRQRDIERGKRVVDPMGLGTTSGLTHDQLERIGKGPQGRFVGAVMGDDDPPTSGGGD